MKLTLARSLRMGTFIPTFMLVLLSLLVGLVMVNVSRQMIQSDYGLLLLLLARLSFKIIPPVFWVGGAIVSALWLALLTHLWQQKDLI